MKKNRALIILVALLTMSLVLSCTVFADNETTTEAAAETVEVLTDGAAATEEVAAPADGAVATEEAAAPADDAATTEAEAPADGEATAEEDKLADGDFSSGATAPVNVTITVEEGKITKVNITNAEGNYDQATIDALVAEVIEKQSAKDIIGSKEVIEAEEEALNAGKAKEDKKAELPENQKNAIKAKYALVDAVKEAVTAARNKSIEAAKPVVEKNIFVKVWEFFSTYILQKAPFMIGFITMLGYVLMKKKWYDVLSGTLKAIIGMLILNVGSGGLVSNFRPILAGLKDRFNLTATVIDPYFGQNAVQDGVEKVFGAAFSQVMLLLLIAFIVNILLVRFNKLTKCRSLFTTGHVQVQQASTAYWLILFALPVLGRGADIKTVPMMIVMAVLLGAYWAVGSNLTVKPMQELTDGAGFAIAHQQMFGIRLGYILADKLFGTNGGKRKKEIKTVGDMEMPGFFSIFNENMVCTAILMTVFFGAIMAVIGKPFFVAAGNLKAGDSFVMFCFERCLNFAVYLAILQLGVRTFVTELTASFQGIADKLLPASVPGVDCAVCYGFGDANAVTFGFLAGLAGQLLAIVGLIIFKSPVLIICGFVPVFFDNATIGLVANEKGGLKACLIIPFFVGIIQVLGSAFIAGFVGMAEFGGYLGMFDWATVWPAITIILKVLGYVGVAVAAIALLALPQIEYARDKKGYFLITEDYEAYKEYIAEKEAK